LVVLAQLTHITDKRKGDINSRERFSVMFGYKYAKVDKNFE